MKAAEAIDWIEPPTRALDDSRAPLYGWFADGVCNTCWNAVDRHVEAGPRRPAGDHPRLPVTGTKATITYAELRDRVARLAGALAARGVGKGDRVVIYMPMVPEALVAMLACARLGAIHSVVFGGFAAPELAVRIDDAKPKAIIAASCGIEPGRVVRYKPLLDAAIDARRRTSPTSASSSSASRRRPTWSPAATSTGTRSQQGAAPGALHAGRRHGPALHPLHLGHDRASPRASCAPTPATWSRSPGRCANIYAVEPGRGLLGRLRRRLGRRPLLHLLRAAARSGRRPSSSRASRSAPPTPAPSGG